MAARDQAVAARADVADANARVTAADAHVKVAEANARMDASVHRGKEKTARVKGVIPSGTLLKVFLIDDRGRVREIYSLAYLQPQVMLNDIGTLYLERRARAFPTR